MAEKSEDSNIGRNSISTYSKVVGGWQGKAKTTEDAASQGLKPTGKAKAAESQTQSQKATCRIEEFRMHG